ncbi:Beige/BEACH domain containing protein [Entamoeba marina]
MEDQPNFNISTLWEQLKGFEHYSSERRRVLLRYMFIYGNEHGFEPSYVPSYKKETVASIILQIFQECNEQQEYVYLLQFFTNGACIIEIIPFLFTQIMHFMTLFNNCPSVEIGHFISILFNMVNDAFVGVHCYLPQINNPMLDFIPDNILPVLTRFYNILKQHPTKDYALLLNKLLSFYAVVLRKLYDKNSQDTFSLVKNTFYNNYGSIDKSWDLLFTFYNNLYTTVIIFCFTANNCFKDDLKNEYKQVFQWILQHHSHFKQEDIEYFLNIIPYTTVSSQLAMSIFDFLLTIPMNTSNLFIFEKFFSTLTSCCRENTLSNSIKKQILMVLLQPPYPVTYHSLHSYHHLLSQLTETSDDHDLFIILYTATTYTSTLLQTITNDISNVTPGLIVNFCNMLQYQHTISQNVKNLINCVSYFSQHDVSTSLFCARQLKLLLNGVEVTQTIYQEFISLLTNSSDVSLLFTILDTFITLNSRKHNRDVFKLELPLLESKIIALNPASQHAVIGKLFTLASDQCVYSSGGIHPANDLSTKPMLVTFPSIFPLLFRVILYSKSSNLQDALINLVSDNTYNCLKFSKHSFSVLIDQLTLTRDQKLKHFLVALAGISFTPSCSIPQMKILMRDVASSGAFTADSFSIFKTVLTTSAMVDFQSFFFRGNSCITSSDVVSFNYAKTTIVLWFCSHAASLPQTLLMLSSPKLHLLSIALTQTNSLLLKIEDINSQSITLAKHIKHNDWYGILLAFYSKGKNYFVDTTILHASTNSKSATSSPINIQHPIIKFTKQNIGCYCLRSSPTHYFYGDISSIIITPTLLSNNDVTQIQQNIDLYRSRPDLLLSSNEKSFVLSPTPNPHKCSFVFEKCQLLKSYSGVNSFYRSDTSFHALTRSITRSTTKTRTVLSPYSVQYTSSLTKTLPFTSALQENTVLESLLTIIKAVVTSPTLVTEFISLQAPQHLHYLLLKSPSQYGLRESFMQIFTDFRIWCNCIKDVQYFAINHLTALKYCVNVHDIFTQLILFYQPNSFFKHVNFIKQPSLLPYDELNELHSNFLSVVLQIASNNITIDNVKCILHYFSMARDTQIISTSLDLIFLHFNAQKKEYIKFADEITTGFLNILSYITTSLQYKVLNIILLFIDYITTFDPCLINQYLLHSCLVAQQFTSTLYNLINSQPHKIQQLLDLPTLSVFLLRFADDSLKQQIATYLHDIIQHENLSKTTFDHPKTIALLIQSLLPTNQAKNIYSLLKVFIIKRMTHLYQKMPTEIASFVEVALQATIHCDEEISNKSPEEQHYLSLFIFEQINVQLRGRISRLKEKNYKEKNSIINAIVVYLTYAHSYVIAFKHYIINSQIVLPSQTKELAKSMLISLQSFVHQLSKTNCDIKLVVGNNIVLPLQQFDISTSLSLLFLNLVEGDITNSISTLNSLVNSYDNAVLISVDILYALRSTPPLEKVILLQKLLWNFCGESKMELQNGINQVRQYAPISDQESLTFLEFINTSLNNPDDLQRLCRGQLISKLRDLIAEIHTSLGSYKELVEESMYQISSISKQFVTILSSTNTSLLQSVDIDLNKVQKVIDCNNNLTQQKVVELNNQLIELKSHWNKFTLTKDEFTYQKVPKHWILTNTTTPIGARYCWKENTKFDPHTSAITYSAVRSTMNTEESCKISKNSQPKFDFGDLECLWVTPKAFEKVTNFQELVALPGKLDISGDCIIFTKNPLQNEYPCENTKNLLKKKSYSYPYQNVVEILLRRNLTEFNGIEIFMKNNSEYYVFPTEQTAKKVLTKLLDACKLVDEPLEVKVQKATQKWTQGKINNFTYLMRLNQLSGRSYNDLSHYPIFPWVIQDYTSTKIDLNNPNIYRDLSLPIPCINPKRKAEEMKRYEELFGEHGAIKDQTPYMYPTFYSACDYVFHFLIRIEPFTTRFIRMNENHYDRPERMFYSIAHTWDICMTSSQCNIELIPEFFYLPNFLINENNFNFGVFPNTQTPLNNVELPPWAPTARDFITINAAALESPIVTAKLPQWIDLIFGFQSKGPAAVRAMNLYHPSCYVENYGGVDDDLFRKRALFSGQLPLQLFTKQHPSRTVLPPIISSLHQLSTHIDNIGTPNIFITSYSIP